MSGIEKERGGGGYDKTKQWSYVIKWGLIIAVVA